MIHTYTYASTRAYIPRYIHRCRYPHAYLHTRIYEHDLKIVPINIEIGKALRIRAGLQEVTECHVI